MKCAGGRYVSNARVVCVRAAAQSVAAFRYRELSAKSFWPLESYSPSPNQSSLLGTILGRCSHTCRCAVVTTAYASRAPCCTGPLGALRGAVRVDLAQKELPQPILLVRAIRHSAPFKSKHPRRWPLENHFLLRVAHAKEVPGREVGKRVSGERAVKLAFSRLSPHSRKQQTHSDSSAAETVRRESGFQVRRPRRRSRASAGAVG